MKFDFSIADRPIMPQPVALRSAYIVHADPTYDVIKGGINNKDFIALRTLDGNGNLIIEGIGNLSLGPRTLVIFKHNKVRRYFCNSKTWIFWWFEFASEDAEEAIKLDFNKVLNIDLVEDEIKNCQSCIEYIRNSNNVSLALASATFSVLLYKWLLHSKTKSLVTPHKEIIEKIIVHIKLNITENISVKDMANMAGLSERRFRQVFKEIIGTQPKRYINNLKISLAEELLKNTPFSIMQISEMLGYSSQFHFCKNFRKSRNITPSQYRNSRKYKILDNQDN